jgi:rhomboid family GlyGly-CTERM serine protease
LQYDRTAILHGEVWRVLTGHLVHWSGDQLFWDGLALGFLGWLCEREAVASFLRCFVLSAILISLTLWFAAPWMATYRGLSGIDSALFALVAVRLGREAFLDRRWLQLALVGIVAGGFALKVGYEFASGATLFVDSSAGGMTPVPLAHVAGAMVGIVCGMMPILAGSRMGPARLCERRPTFFLDGQRNVGRPFPQNVRQNHGIMNLARGCDRTRSGFVRASSLFRPLKPSRPSTPGPVAPTLVSPSDEQNK